MSTTNHELPQSDLEDMTSFNPKQIPSELKAIHQWIGWEAVPTGERIEKIPLDVRTGQRASSTNQDTWTDYYTAVVKACQSDRMGVGFVFTREAGIVGVDLDKCRDSQTGELEPWAEEIVNELNSYTEVSPSGRGLHIYIRAKELPEGRRKRGKVEVYNHGRYFTVTGDHVPGTPTTIEERTAELVTFHAEYLADPEPTITPPASVPILNILNHKPSHIVLSDDDIIKKCRSAANSAKFERLWSGDHSGHASRSEADLALLGQLKFYTQDPLQLDRLFRQSGLMRPKWDERHGEKPYGEKTIEEALRHVGEVYSPSHRAMNESQGGSVSSLPPDEWPEPDCLGTDLSEEPYPIDALPDEIRSAVDEVHNFTQAPIALIASSALSVMSAAVQAYVDVQRTERLVGPTGVLFLSLAPSGERKTTSDNLFSKPLHDYDREQAEKAKPAVKDHAAKYAAWEAEREGILTAIKQAAKSGKSPGEIDTLKKKLADHEAHQPSRLRVPRLLHGDTTPESLAHSLAHQWPSVGILTSEAGLILGSHGMGTEALMRNLTLYNVLWDGGAHHVGRRTSESYTVRGARLTMGLQVQPDTLHAFLDRTDGLPRGTGFFARFLISHPPSTQGYRPFREPPTAWPALDVFHRRIKEILNTPVPISDDGALTPTILLLTPKAKAVWVAFYNAIEEQLRPGGELCEVKDVASKVADNAARLAALFQYFSSNISNFSISSVEVEKMESACRIVAWHLHESRRFFGQLAMSPEQAAPAKLDAWLLAYCHKEGVSQVSTSLLLQYGPSSLRKKASLEEALRELEGLHRVRLLKKGNKTVIEVNPALLPGGAA